MNWTEAKETKGFKLCHINIRSLLPKFDIFAQEFLDDKLDVIGVSETWLHNLVNDNLVVKNGYNFIRSDRSSDKRGGGLCFYIKECLEFQALPGFCDEDGDVLPIVVEK